MKPNFRSLNYGTLYSLTITTLPRERYSIDTIVITKLNTKIQNKRMIVLEIEKRFEKPNKTVNGGQNNGANES